MKAYISGDSKLLSLEHLSENKYNRVCALNNR